MIMALNDIYRITLSTAYDAAASVTLQNKFYYKETTTIPGNDDAAELHAQFKVVVLPLIQNVIANQAHISALSTENIIPSADNVFESFGTTDFVGQRAGEAMPPFVTWAFRYNRVSTAVRNGQKRIGPISETDQSAGVAVGTITSNLASLASQMGAVLGTIGITSLYTPRIFRVAEPGFTIPEKVVPAKLQADFDVSDVDYIRISTQNSRKFGVGI